MLASTTQSVRFLVHPSSLPKVRPLEIGLSKCHRLPTQPFHPSLASWTITLDSHLVQSLPVLGHVFLSLSILSFRSSLLCSYNNCNSINFMLNMLSLTVSHDLQTWILCDTILFLLRILHCSLLWYGFYTYYGIIIILWHSTSCSNLWKHRFEDFVEHTLHSLPERHFSLIIVKTNFNN